MSPPRHISRRILCASSTGRVLDLRFQPLFRTTGKFRRSRARSSQAQFTPSYEIPNKPVAMGEKPAATVSPERPHQESMLVTVLLPARVHTGPSVDTPISHFYAVGTPLRATSYRNDWFEISEPGTSKSGWIYKKYLGAIGNSEPGKVALQEAQGQKPVATVSVPAKRYAKATPAKRYASAIGFSKKSSATTSKPNRGRTEMASLLQRAFSGY
jgi:hypothetical protein